MDISASKIILYIGEYGACLIPKGQRIALLRDCTFLCLGFYTIIKAVGIIHLNTNITRVPLGILGSLIVVKFARINPIVTALVTLCIAYVTASRNTSRNCYTAQQFTDCLANPKYIFPPNPIVEGDLDLEGCPNFASLPEGLHVKGHLILRDCINLASLPQRLRVEGVLDLGNCTGLTSLPEGLYVRGALDLSGCTGLTSLPQGLSVKFNLNLNGCTGLISLPQGLSVGGNLNLRGCTGLTSLPQGLSVKFNLNLTGCTGLTSLPQGLSVGFDLNLTGCTGLTSLPERLSIGGDLYLTDCTGLTSLPPWITQLGPRPGGQIRNVYLENTGLSENIRNELMQAHAPGMQFYFSQAAFVPEEVFEFLKKALEFWMQATNDTTLSLPDVTIADADLNDVLRFLGRLTATAEYKNIQSRAFLAQRVMEVLILMANDEEFNSRSIDLMHGGLISCDDRIISALDEIELMKDILRLESSTIDETELRDLGKSYFLLERVKEKADKHKKTLGWVDPIEIYLAFQIGLADRFKLPLSTRNMIFREYAKITDEQIQAAGDVIEKEYTEEKLDQFLKTWSPWIKHQRRIDVLTYPYEKLDPIISDEECICCIGGAPTNKPVMYGTQVYDYDAFVKWYVNNGTNPFTRQPMVLSKLKKLKYNIDHPILPSPIKKLKIELDL